MGIDGIFGINIYISQLFMSLYYINEPDLEEARAVL